MFGDLRYKDEDGQLERKVRKKVVISALVAHAEAVWLGVLRATHCLQKRRKQGQAAPWQRKGKALHAWG